MTKPGWQRKARDGDSEARYVPVACYQCGRRWFDVYGTAVLDVVPVMRAGQPAAKHPTLAWSLRCRCGHALKIGQIELAELWQQLAEQGSAKNRHTVL